MPDRLLQALKVEVRAGGQATHKPTLRVRQQPGSRSAILRPCGQTYTGQPVPFAKNGYGSIRVVLV